MQHPRYRAFLFMSELDIQSQVLKDARSDIRKLRDEVNHYKGQAGMYQLIYDDQVEVSKAIMVITGIAAELKSELNEYKSKNGQNERVIKAQGRLNLFARQLGILSKVQTDNFILKTHNRTLQNENHLLKCDIEDLNRRLQLHTENL